MAPEQLHGVARPESNLHGVGATLLFVLAGRPPSDLPHRKLRVDFRPHVSVSPAFGAWLARLLEPAPEDRFPTAREALVALRSPGKVPAGGVGFRWTTVALTMVLFGVLAIAGGIGLYEVRKRF